MFYESQVSPVVLKFMVSFFISESLRSPHNLSGGNLGWYVKQFRLRMYTRNPCIKTVLINTIKTKNSRGFSIPGTISTSGFVSYCFNGDVREVYLSDIDKLREEGFISLESEESHLKGKSIAVKILPQVRSMDHFELGGGASNFNSHEIARLFSIHP